MRVARTRSKANGHKIARHIDEFPRRQPTRRPLPETPICAVLFSIADPGKPDTRFYLKKTAAKRASDWPPS
tara:strand:- start:207 stop:419 length:213 start_codon:yes stop_codon:yes gene_type:complete